MKLQLARIERNGKDFDEYFSDLIGMYVVVSHVRGPMWFIVNDELYNVDIINDDSMVIVPKMSFLNEFEFATGLN